MMAGVVPFLPVIAGIGGAVASNLIRPKAPKPQAATPIPQRNEAAEAAMGRDRLARRRGVVANMVLGAGGAESSAGKTSLGT